MAIKSFTYNGISTRDLGLVIQDSPSFQIPEKDYTITHIPGRSGDVAIYNGCYKNFTRTYNVAMVYTKEGNRVFPWNNTALANRLKTVTDFRERAKEVAKWLTTPTDYADLQDDFETDVTFKALYYNSAELQNFLNQGCAFNITFECQPIKYYRVGASSGINSTDIYTDPATFTGGGTGPEIAFASVGEYPILSISGIKNAHATNSNYMDGCTIILHKSVDGTISRVGKVIFARIPEGYDYTVWSNITMDWYSGKVKNSNNIDLTPCCDVYLGASSVVHSHNIRDINLREGYIIKVVTTKGPTILSAIDGEMHSLIKNIATGNIALSLTLNQVINNYNFNVEPIIDINFSSTFKNEYLHCLDNANNIIFKIVSDNSNENTITGLTIDYKTGSILTKPYETLYKHITLKNSNDIVISYLPSISNKGIKFVSNNPSVRSFTIRKNEWTLW